MIPMGAEDTTLDDSAVRERWRRIADTLDFAFQPIVDVRTGLCRGYEALLRNWAEAGFLSIPAVFDAAHDELALYRLDLALREKAIDKFAQIPRDPRAQLFYNIDNRLLEMPDYAPGNTAAMLARRGMSHDALCFEISERYEFKSYAQTRDVLAAYAEESYTIALDDYGAGFSGLQLLYHCEPGYLKIDRFFIRCMERDVKKRLMVSHVISMAHLLGVAVIGEGVETEQEFLACREIGCDLVQGYLVQSPTTDVGALLPRYPLVGEPGAGDGAAPLHEHVLFNRLDRVGVPAR